MSEHTRFESIRGRIEAEMVPVRPLSGAWKRALFLPLLFGMLVGIVLLVLGLRSDYEVLGPSIAWGFAVLQCLAAYAVLTLGLRITIPGADLPITILAFVALLGLGLHFAVAELSFQLSPISVEAHQFWRMVVVCASITLGLGLLPLAVFLVFASRGLPRSATTVGLLCGLSSGLCGEAAWRMHCAYTSWDHVLPAHSGAILLTALLGAALGSWAQSRNCRSSK